MGKISQVWEGEDWVIYQKGVVGDTTQREQEREGHNKLSGGCSWEGNQSLCVKTKQEYQKGDRT